MAARASVPRIWNDRRLVYVLLLWGAFAAGLVAYFGTGYGLRRAAPPAPAAQAQAGDRMFTGSIIVMPRAGNDCWKMMIDNRTGRMWEDGYLNCDTAVAERESQERTARERVGRMNAIGSAFRDRR
jgi:hypothetical protein